jgi:hypothetical protein
MPVCEGCGNRSSFQYDVEGTEVRHFEAETGDHIETVDEVVHETTGVRCTECGSENVTHE